MPDTETTVSENRQIINLKTIDPGSRRALSANIQELIQLFPFSFSIDLNTAARHIFHMPFDTVSLSIFKDKVPETDTLYPPLYDYSDSFHPYKIYCLRSDVSRMKELIHAL